MRQVPEWGTIPRMLRDQAACRTSTIVVADGHARLRLRQLQRQAAEGARALIAMGVQPRDRVAIVAPNGLRWVISAFAIWDTGAAVIPLSSGVNGTLARQLLQQAQVSVLLACDDTLLSALAETCGEPAAGRPYAGLPDLRTVVMLDEPPTAGGTRETRRPGVLRLRNFLARGASVAPRVAEQRALAVLPTDKCEFLAPPGASGMAELTHAQLLRVYSNWSETVTLREGDRYLVITPFSHGFGLNAGLLACVLRGATILAAPRFAPVAVADLVEGLQANVLAGPPTLFNRLLDSLRGRPRRALPLRVAICENAAAPAELIRRLLAETAVQRVINAYGLGEATVAYPGRLPARGPDASAEPSA